MIKILLLLLFFLTSCSLNSDSAYWNQKLYSDYEELKYDKDYSFNEYNEILDKYSAQSETPNIN